MQLTIERVKQLALQNYEQGGDVIIECYDDAEIQELISAGIDTEEKLLELFQQRHAIDEENRKAALWYAYGTTDEAEIERIQRAECEPEETETEPEEPYDDPCYGCQRYSGYNCKHCPHGDDGRYSVYDVYTPAELGIY